MDSVKNYEMKITVQGKKMSQFKMPEKNQKASFVKENFDIIASKYDLFNDLNSFFLHRLWKNSIIALIQKIYPKANLICMDLCCGTGDISVRLAKLPNLEKLVCVDFSENMISYSRTRLAESKNSIVEIGDATQLQKYESNSFDVVTIGFGLRNVNDIPKALSEVNRILKTDGLFINLDVGKVKNPIIRYFADFYFFKIVPLLGYIIWGGKNSMFDYLPVSSLSYPDQNKLKLLFEESNFKDVQFTNYVFGNVAMHWGSKK